MTLDTYSRWTARVALVVLTLALLAAIALIPARAYGGVTWPLPRRWAAAHAGADVLMTLAWIVVGIALLVLVASIFVHLWRRAR